MLICIRLRLQSLVISILFRFVVQLYLFILASGCPPTGELHIWLREIVGLLPTKRGAPSTYVKRYVCTLIASLFVFCYLSTSVWFVCVQCGITR